MDWETINRNRSRSVKIKDLTPEDGRNLVEISRKAVREYINNGTRPGKDVCKGKFADYAGVFVTLKERSELRGCIGYPYPVFTLCEGVINAAIAASTEDPRFRPVEAVELRRMEFEVTVLGFPARIDQLNSSPEKAIMIGLHGLIVRRGYFDGLLLPQVAVEESFSPEEFLSATCVKAGLSPSAWKDRETEVYVFEGRTFH